MNKYINNDEQNIDSYASIYHWINPTLSTNYYLNQFLFHTGQLMCLLKQSIITLAAISSKKRTSAASSSHQGSNKKFLNAAFLTKLLTFVFDFSSFFLHFFYIINIKIKNFFLDIMLLN